MVPNAILGPCQALQDAAAAGEDAAASNKASKPIRITPNRFLIGRTPVVRTLAGYRARHDTRTEPYTSYLHHAQPEDSRHRGPQHKADHRSQPSQMVDHCRLNTLGLPWAQPGHPACAISMRPRARGPS